MTQYSSDTIINVIYQQIKEPIKLCIEHGHLSAAMKLIYAGIDTMAFLGMSRSKSNVTRSDFVIWVEQYIHFEGQEQLSGLDVYGARCSMLHNHSVYSEVSRKGLCRLIGYADKMYPPVRFNPAISKELVIVSIPAFADTFFAGIDKYLIDLFSDSNKKQIAEQRLNTLVHNFRVADNQGTS
jgi:hypothetical protein